MKSGRVFSHGKPQRNMESLPGFTRVESSNIIELRTVRRTGRSWYHQSTARIEQEWHPIYFSPLPLKLSKAISIDLSFLSMKKSSVTES